jgi:thiosulfate/3-mercaptopyruvate sulfurtransferase
MRIMQKITSPHVSAETIAYVNPQIYVDSKWVAENKDNSDVVVVDLRSAADYAKGHIPGAINFEAAKRLRDGDSRILPVSTMARLLGDAGISEHSRVVWYGFGFSTFKCVGETVGFWILEYLGNTHSSVFVKGIEGWIKEGYPTTIIPTTLQPTTFHASVNESAYASTQWVLDHLRDSSVIILDVRTVQEYNGTNIQALRGGHIPGAINVDTFANFEMPSFKLLPADKLYALYAGIDKTKTIVIYCQTGGRGSLTCWVLQLLGFPKVRLYDDGWTVWGNDVRLPVESESWFDINTLQKDVSALKATVEKLNAKVDQLQATPSSPNPMTSTKMK